MKTNKTLMKIAGISYCLFGCLLLDIPVIGILVIAAGVFLYVESQQSFDHIYESRALIYTIAIVGLFNVLGSILLFISISSIVSEKKSNSINAPPEKVLLNKESKRIDVLLKLGVGMVFLSALLLSTTSWQFISNNVKVLSLVGLSIIFLLLSFVTEKKFKLYNSAYQYWLLSLSLLTFSVVGALFFGLFGNVLTYSGQGKMLSFAITGFVASILLIITYYKYSKKSVLYSSYIALTITAYCLLSYLQYSVALNLSIIALSLIFLNLIVHKKGTIYFFSKVLSYILFILLIKYQSVNVAEQITASIVALVNLNYFTLLFPEEDEHFLPILCSYILIISGTQAIHFLGGFYNLIISMMLAVYTLLISSNFIKTKDTTKKLCYFVFSFVMLSISCQAINLTEVNSLIMSPIVIVLVFYLVNTIIKYGIFNVTKWKFAYHFETIILLLLVGSVLKTLSSQFDIVYILGTTAVIASIIHALTKDKYQKKIYYIFLALVLTFGILSGNKLIDVFATVLIIPSSLYFFLDTYLKYKDTLLEKFKLVLSYVIMLSSITFPYVIYNILSLDVVLSICLVLLLSLFTAFALNSSLIKKTTYFYIVVPMLALLSNYGYTDIKNIIVSNGIILYLVTLLIALFVKNNIAKNISIIVVVSIFMLSLLSYPDMLTSLYIGIVGLIMILLNINRSENAPIFVAGIVITIINIIYSLIDIWTQIPFWLYLLVGGLTIIVIVLIKELKSKN